MEDEKWEDFTNEVNRYLDSTDVTNKIHEITANDKQRLTVNLDTLRQKHPTLVPLIMKEPLKAFRIFETRLQSAIKELGNNNNNKAKRHAMTETDETKYKVTFEGSLGSHLVTPRGLTCKLVNNYVGVQGIVTSTSRVRPKLLKSVHYCEATSKPLTREYNDNLQITDQRISSYTNAIPLYDENKNPLSMEYGLSQYKDIQRISLQEMPEKVPTGQLSRGVDIVLQDDLVDKVKPGDRVQIMGVLTPVTTGGTFNIGTFKTEIIATSVQVISSNDDCAVSPKELTQIKQIAERKDLLELTSKSIAPSIYGHSYVKKALLLQLLGGVEKVLDSGTRLRGDLNMLLIGDPGCAKSQFLRHMMSMAHLSFSTTGRGSSGVGLTAAVTHDRETGERQLEAGAMVLADKGVICIDEFDKMSQEDRVAMHEVMEQQTVTIAKAGIHVSLNARCSVLAAANPIYGEFQRDKSLNVNIGLPDSLLSRFDLIFLILDDKNPDTDRLVAERVTNNHRYQGDNAIRNFYNMNEYSGVIETEISAPSNEAKKFNPLTHESKKDQILSQQFLRKYIAYSKKFVNPVLTENAKEIITKEWSNLRQKDFETIQSKENTRFMPITVRTLESLIRLATAHAKLRLSKEIEKIDCEVAVEMLTYSLFGEDEVALLKEKENMILPSKSPKKSLSKKGSVTKQAENKNPNQRLNEQSASKRLKTEDSALRNLEDKVLNIPITKEHQKIAFKGIIELDRDVKKNNKNFLRIDELWEWVMTNGKGVIESKEFLFRVVQDLDDKSKIVYNKTDESIYLL